MKNSMVKGASKKSGKERSLEKGVKEVSNGNHPSVSKKTNDDDNEHSNVDIASNGIVLPSPKHIETNNEPCKKRRKGISKKNSEFKVGKSSSDDKHQFVERLCNNFLSPSPSLNNQTKGDCPTADDDLNRDSNNERECGKKRKVSDSCEDVQEQAEFTVGPSPQSRHSLFNRSRSKRRKSNVSPHTTSSRNTSFRSPNTMEKPQAYQKVDKDCYVAVDCEMVGVGAGGVRSVLGRCSIVGFKGAVLYDKYVQSPEPVTNYRTAYSGITPEHLAMAEPWEKAQQEIHDCLKNKIIVAHSIRNDLKVLHFNPHRYLVRDTSQCLMLTGIARQKGYEGPENGSIPLKSLAKAILGKDIQLGADGHDSVEDARAAMELFRRVRNGWEKTLFMKWHGEGLNLAHYVNGLNGKQEIRDADGMRVTDFRSDCGTGGGENSLEEKEDYLSDSFWSALQ